MKLDYAIPIHVKTEQHAKKTFKAVMIAFVLEVIQELSAKVTSILYVVHIYFHRIDDRCNVSKKFPRLHGL